MGTIRNPFNSSLAWLVPLVIWTQLVIGSAWWAIHSAGQHAAEIAAQRGRDLFMMIELTRAWNSYHGGVYAVRSDFATPNPHLVTSNRDLKTTKGIELTMIDPAYMARQISELSRSRNFHFHLTSLKPLRPGNAPDVWERSTLEAFERGAEERIELIGGEQDGEFRYMAPLKVEPMCLSCHAVQGYELGDIRGGISINIDAAPILAAKQTQVTRTIVAHLLAWAAVSVIIYMNVRGVRLGMMRLREKHRTQAKTIAQKDRALRQAKQKLDSLQREDSLTGFYNRDFFEKSLQEALDRAEARDERYGLLVIELDFFREFNDANGILEGDIVIRMVADVVRKLAPKDDALFGRYIGSSFAVGINAYRNAECAALAERVRRTVFELGIKHEYSAAAKFVTVTIGTVSAAPGSVEDVRALLKKAATAMFHGKRDGRNRVMSA